MQQKRRPQTQATTSLGWAYSLHRSQSQRAGNGRQVWSGPSSDCPSHPSTSRLADSVRRERFPRVSRSIRHRVQLRWDLQRLSAQRLPLEHGRPAPPLKRERVHQQQHAHRRRWPVPRRRERRPAGPRSRGLQPSAILHPSPSRHPAQAPSPQRHRHRQPHRFRRCRRLRRSPCEVARERAGRDAVTAAAA